MSSHASFRRCHSTTPLLKSWTADNYELTLQHPSFESDPNKGYPYDFGLIKLPVPANVGSNYIGVIEMSIADEDGAPSYAGEECVITGWGRTCG